MKKRTWIAVCFDCKWVEQFDEIVERVHPEHEYTWIPAPQRLTSK